MPRQSDLRFTFAMSPNGDCKRPIFEVVSFELREALSAPFVLTLELSSHDSAIDFGDVLDQSALFTLWRGEHAVRYVHGVVSALQQGTTGARRSRYRVVVEPQLARAGLRSDWRIFQQQTVPDIFKTVLKRSGLIDVKLHLSKEHLPREYCVQPGETDLDFVQRLSAEEGLYYAFEHSAQGHRLIQGDMLYMHGLIPGGAVTYNATPGGDQAEPCLWAFRYTEQVRTASQIQRDRYFQHPQYLQQHTYTAPHLDHQGRDYERFDWPGRYKADEAGKPFTQTRLLSLRRDAQVAEIEGDDARLQPGLAFDVEGHPREDWNTGWRTTRMVHTGIQTTSQEEDSADATSGTHYRYTAEIIPDRVEWKAPLYPKPRIDGPQIATVVGPPGEELHCDSQGRVLVQFPWDRYGQSDEHSSCWIRVAQNWAGAGWGHMAIPRIGQQVVISYVDGDSDQPLITARVYDAINPPPYELPKFETLSTIKSKEHKGNRANELRIDDTSAQISAALMSDHGATALHLGYLTQPRPKGGAPRGEGFELRSDEHGAVRAAKGLLVSAYAQPQGSSTQLDMAELLQLIDQIAQQAKSLLDVAQSHQALQAAHTARDQLVQAAHALGAGANNRQNDSGNQPIVVMGAPAGLVTATPASVLTTAGTNIESLAQQDHTLTAARRMHFTAGEGISAFAVDGGIRHLANQGDVLTQAQHGTVSVQASEDIRQEANKQFITTAGDKMVWQCGKSAVVLNADGRVEIFGTQLLCHANWVTDDPASLSTTLHQWDTTPFNDHFKVTLPDGTAAAHQRYELVHPDGGRTPGVTDAEGRLTLQKGLNPAGLGIVWLDVGLARDAS
ncbi:type VI secretion system Vgr family protein [Dyella sp. 20L07]|uniref:type VI secretion system Vgr family protein n=1 Tax=Dyella sp. 20L07 TaxID=3384240 RepID=UPI003D2B52EE